MGVCGGLWGFVWVYGGPRAQQATAQRGMIYLFTISKSTSARMRYKLNSLLMRPQWEDWQVADRYRTYKMNLAYRRIIAQKRNKIKTNPICAAPKYFVPISL